MRANADHIVAIGDGGNVARCLHCGGVLTVALPIEIGAFSRLSRRFIRDHRGCPKTEAGGAASEAGEGAT